MSWRNDGICFGTFDPSFYGDDEDVGTSKQHEAARRICYSCPVQVECLSYCLETNQKWGVWGGLTESQRKRYLFPALRSHSYGRRDVAIAQDVLIEVLVRCTLPEPILVSA